MRKNVQPQNIIKKECAAERGVIIELDKEAIENLTGYLDILIQMDLAIKQRNERNDNEDILSCNPNTNTNNN